MNFDFVVNYFKKILVMLDNVIGSGFIYRNLNMFGLGYEFDKNTKTNIIDFNVKILKYTDTTLLSLDDKYFNNFEITKCFSKNCIGSIIPYYIIIDYYNQVKNWKPRLNKFYSLSLVEIILVLFYTDSKYLEKLYEFIIGPSVLESRLQYFHMYKRFSSEKNIRIIFDLVNKLEIKFSDVNPLFEEYIETLILNLLLEKYEKIYYPNQILIMIQQIEKSNLEFKITHISKDDIYIPNNSNYLKSNNSKNMKIIHEDELVDPLVNANLKSENYSYIDKDIFDKDKIILRLKKNTNKKNEIGSKTGSKTDSNTDIFQKLYIKYKSKYLMLKNKK